VTGECEYPGNEKRSDTVRMRVDRNSAHLQAAEEAAAGDDDLLTRVRKK
jgi:hypothetical protein